MISSRVNKIVTGTFGDESTIGKHSLFMSFSVPTNDTIEGDVESAKKEVLQLFGRLSLWIKTDDVKITIKDND